MSRFRRKEDLLRLRPNESQKGRAEQNARHELADHRRLLEPLRQFAEEARRQEDHDDGCKESGLKVHRPRLPPLLLAWRFWLARTACA